MTRKPVVDTDHSAEYVELEVELNGVQSLAECLIPLNKAERIRVLKWILSRFNIRYDELYE